MRELASDRIEQAARAQANADGSLTGHGPPGSGLDGALVFATGVLLGSS